MELFTLNNGTRIPAIGLGTWQSKPEETKTAVKAAVQSGYRLIDCAYVYGNEADVGAALAELFHEDVVHRQDLLIISKLWNTRHHPDDVKKGVQDSLSRLGLQYIDLYLIHWPMAFKRGEDMFPKDSEGNIIYENFPYSDTWKALEKLVDEGLIKNIGLSNFNSEQIQYVLDHSRIKPSVLQVECHPYFQQTKLVEFCRQRGIVVMAYSSFGSPGRPQAKEKSLLEDECLVKIASQHGKSPAHVVLRWLYQRGVGTIPKSVTPERIQQNIQIFDFELSVDEMNEIQKLDKNVRMIAPAVERNGVMEWRDKDAPYFPFNTEY